MKNGAQVTKFERSFAEYVHAEYAVAFCNGTATLHTAAAVLGFHGWTVAVPPLTMASTTIAMIHAGCRIQFCDVAPLTWIMRPTAIPRSVGVSLYGLHPPASRENPWMIDDAAQTLRQHNPASAFTSYSFQASKILALGEGGMLVTNDERLAREARQFASLGYALDAKEARIDPATIKSSTVVRHHHLGYNYRMNDVTAALGSMRLLKADQLLEQRRGAAWYYAQAIKGVPWLTTQVIPPGWQHDYWAFAVEVSGDIWSAGQLAEAVVAQGGERPFGAWRLTYREPAFRHLVYSLRTEVTMEDGAEGYTERRTFDSADLDDPMSARYQGSQESICPVAERLQPRLLQFQTNDLGAARHNAIALAKAIEAIEKN